MVGYHHPMDFEKLHREESGRILSTLIRFSGDFDLAEETLPELARPESLELPSLWSKGRWCERAN